MWGQRTQESFVFLQSHRSLILSRFSGVIIWHVYDTRSNVPPYWVTQNLKFEAAMWIVTMSNIIYRISKPLSNSMESYRSSQWSMARGVIRVSWCRINNNKPQILKDILEHCFVFMTILSRSQCGGISDCNTVRQELKTGWGTRDGEWAIPRRTWWMAIRTLVFRSS